MKRLDLLRRRVSATSPPVGDAMTLRILETAADVFAVHGYAATSLDEVIATCGIGRDTLYRRFPSKLELFIAVVRHCRQQVDARFSTFVSDASPDPLVRLKSALRWLLDINLEPRLIAFQRIAFSETAVTGSAIEDAPNVVGQYLLDTIGKAQAAGSITEGDKAEISTFLVNAIIIGPLTRAMLGAEQALSEDARATLFERMWALTSTGICVDHATS